MKSILYALAFLVQSSFQTSYDIHRHLSEDPLFITDKADIVQTKFSIAPEMKLMSQMQRYISHVKPKDMDGNVIYTDDEDPS